MFHSTKRQLKNIFMNQQSRPIAFYSNLEVRSVNYKLIMVSNGNIFPSLFLLAF